MGESENQVLTAKADEGLGDEVDRETPKAPKKRGRALWIVLAVLAACMLFGLGAIAGGGAVYGLTRARSRILVRPSVERWVLPREMPRGVPDLDLPMWPRRGGIGLGTGAMIVEVVPDSPADQAGLSEGDLLVALEGKEIDAENDLATMIAEYKPGDKVTIDVAELGPRFGQESREVTVTLAEHPEAEGKAYLGVTFVPLSSDEFGPHGRMYWFHEFGDDEDERRAPRFEFRLPRR